MDSKKIFISDYIPSLNKGEGAILYGMIATFKEYINCYQIYLWSNNLSLDVPRFEPLVKIIDASGLSVSGENKIAMILSSIFISLRYVLFLMLYKAFGRHSLIIMRHDVWKVLLDSDIVIVGHDDTLGNSRLSFSCALNIIACYFLRKKMAVYAVSFGVYKNKFLRFLSKMLFKRVNLITFREELSYNNFHNLIGSHVNMHVTTDPAFLLEAVSSKRAEEMLLEESIDKGLGCLVGITVAYGSPVYRKAFGSLADTSEKYSRHIQIMSEAVSYLIDKFNAFVIFMPHVIGPQEEKDDRIISQDIFLSLKRQDRARVLVKDYSPSEIKGIIGKFDFFIGERLHSVFNAISMGIPAISISFPSDYRAYGIIGKALGEERLLYNVEFLTKSSLLERIDEIWRKKDEIRRDLMLKIPRLKERAFLDGRLIRELLN